MSKVSLSRLALAGMMFFVLQPGAVLAGDQTARLAMPKADRVVVLKQERQLILMRDDRVLRVFRVALGRYATGPKREEGDARTPEGEYTLDFKLEDSAFYKAIHISYPNQRDLELARMRGVDPGGKIMIHGLPDNMSAARVGHPALDWTQGCIALTNREMDVLWQMVDEGTPIEIHP